MKIRNGFISNSSSSSFVVAFPKIPTSVDEIKQLMFGDLIEFPTETDSYFTKYSTEEIAETVYGDIINQTPNNNKEILDAVSRGWYDGKPEYPYRTLNELIDDHRKALKMYTKANIDAAKQLIDKFKRKNKDSFIYVFYYADEEGDYFSMMEHSGIFENLPYMRTSYH